MFVNKFYNEDDVNNLIEWTNQTCLGRWFYDICKGIFLKYSIPTVNGMLSILLLTITAIYISKFFDIKERGLIFLCGSVLVTFPVVACNNAYMHGGYMYSLSILLAVLFNYFLLKSNIKGHTLLAVLSLVLSLSLYQVYICFVVGMFWVWLIIYTANRERKNGIKEVIMMVIKYFAYILFSLIIYYITMKLSLMITNTVLASYQNLDKVFEIHLLDYFIGMLKTYYRGALFLVGCFYGRMSFYALIFHFLILLFSTILLYNMFKAGKYKINIVLILELLLLPMFIESSEIMAATAQSRHILMRFSSVLWYIIPIIILDRSGFAVNKENSKYQKLLMITIGLVTAFSFYICNLAYYKCNLTTSNMEAFLTRVAMSIESTEGYVPNETKVWIDSTSGKPLYLNNVDDFPQITNLMGVNDEYRLFNLGRLKSIMKHYLYFESCDPTDEDIVNIKQTDEYKKMNCYPLNNSVMWIDDVIVVKLSK